MSLDYKILSKIIPNRLLKVMGEVVRSRQSCSVRGQNIQFGALSAIQYKEKVWRRGPVVSYDLYKAYYQVCLPFLYKVMMKKMKFSQRFIDWIKIC